MYPLCLAATQKRIHTRSEIFTAQKPSASHTMSLRPSGEGLGAAGVITDLPEGMGRAYGGEGRVAGWSRKPV